MSLFRNFVCFVLLVACTVASADESTWLLDEPQTAAANKVEVERVSSSPLRSLRKVGGALAIVLGGFFLITVGMRKRESPAAAANQLMNCLGSTQIAPNIRLHLVRLGQRVLVLHINGQNVQRVAEIDDEQEVATILAAAGQSEAITMPRSVDEMMQGYQAENNRTARAIR